MVVETQKKLYTEGHTPAGKSWCLSVTNQPLGIDQALLCAGPWSGCKGLSSAKDRQVSAQVGLKTQEWETKMDPQ